MQLPVQPDGPGHIEAARPVRVMIADDSVVVRGLVSRWLAAEDGIEVVATAPNGRLALVLARQFAPDIVLLDLDMPELDGVAALPRLLAERPGLSVVVVSTLTPRNAELSFRCLRLGAIDCLPKPASARELTLGLSFREELVAKIRGIASRHRGGSGADTVATPRADPAPMWKAAQQPRAVAIGASTGGPRALACVLRGLGGVSAAVPILIAQHMPAIFTTVLAQQLEAESGIPTREGVHGEPVRPGRAYVAPGGRHLGLAPATTAGEPPTIRIDHGPALHHCRPSLDILLRDMAAVYGGGSVAAVLTGMGRDGLEGAHRIAAAGGTVLAQDEASSVVWGMPGAIVRSGLARAVLPPAEIAAAIERFVLDVRTGRDRLFGGTTG